MRKKGVRKRGRGGSPIVLEYIWSHVLFLHPLILSPPLKLNQVLHAARYDMTYESGKEGKAE